MATYQYGNQTKATPLKIGMSILMLAILGMTSASRAQEDPSISHDSEVQQTFRPEPVAKESGGVDFAFDIAEKVTPEPYKIAVKATKFATGWLFPKPDMTLEMLKKIDKKLDEMNEKLESIELISNTTLDAVNSLSLEITRDHYFGIIKDINDSVHINDKYQQFYGEGPFPLKDVDFYDYAKGLCNEKGECNEYVVGLLGGVATSKSSEKKTLQQQDCASNLPPSALLFCFQGLITASGAANKWTELNHAYDAQLKNSKGKFYNMEENDDNLVVYYLAAMYPLVSLELDLIKNMVQLYYMNQLQLALYYTHNDVYKNINVNFPFPYPNHQLGEEGYRQAKENMDEFYETILMERFYTIFGRTNDKDDDSIIRYWQQADYLNYVTSDVSHSSSDIFDTANMSEHCWINKLHMPSNKTGLFTGYVTAFCAEDPQTNDPVLEQVFYSIPYGVLSSHYYDGSAPTKKIMYKDGKLIAQEFKSFSKWTDYSGWTADKKNSLGGTAWVAHSGGSLRYHLMYQEMNILLKTGSESNKLMSYNNYDKTEKNGSTRKPNERVYPGEIIYDQVEGDSFYGSANPGAWANLPLIVTKNGHFYWVVTYFVGQHFGNNSGDYNPLSSLIGLRCLKGDTLCAVSNYKKNLTFSDPDGGKGTTGISLGGKDRPKCPTSDWKNFHCDPSDFFVNTSIPEKIYIRPLGQ